MGFLKGINGWTFPPKTPLAEAAAAASAAGFECIEPTIVDEGELTLESTEDTCKQLADQVRSAGLEISSLATGLHWGTPLTSPEAVVRQRAVDDTIRMLDKTRWMGAGALLVVPGVVSHFARRTLEVPYADALNYACESLRALMPEAEARGVVIAIENVWNHFLVSPIEMRDMIDRVNSAWIGAYLDTGNVLRYGVTHDWITTLGKQIARVHLKDFNLDIATLEGFCPLGEGHVDWPETMAALRRVGYDGPLTFEGPGDLTDISSRMDHILTL